MAIRLFPFLLGRAFIEAFALDVFMIFRTYFPSFWEGLSLRRMWLMRVRVCPWISLPFGKGFH